MANERLLTDEEIKLELKKYFLPQQLEFQEPEFTVISGIIAVIRKEQDAKSYELGRQAAAKEIIEKAHYSGGAFARIHRVDFEDLKSKFDIK